MTIKYKLVEANDWAYIISGWIKSARKSPPHTYIHNEDYFVFYRHKVLNLLDKSITKIIYDTDAPEVYLGFIVYAFTVSDDLVIHWMYIPELLRRKQYATDLVLSICPDLFTSNKKIIATALPSILDEYKRPIPFIELQKKYQSKLIFNPYFNLLSGDE